MIDFFTAATLPVDLVAVCLIDTIVDEKEPQSTTIKQLCAVLRDQHQVTEWTTTEFCKQLASVLPELGPPTMADTVKQEQGEPKRFF